MDNFVADGRRCFKSFKKLFPQFNPTKIAKPAKSELMATMGSIVPYAFAVYEEPKVKGFVEETSFGARIRHLN